MPFNWNDLRQAVRSLTRTPVVSVAAVLCLGLGLGSATAVFSAVNTALLRRLPFRDPGELVTVYRTTPHFETGPFSAPNYADLARDTRGLSGMAALTDGSMLLTLGSEASEVQGYRVTENLFDILGTRAWTGRTLQPSDRDLDVVVIGEEFWRERLGADAAAVGGSLTIDGRPHEVVGILPRGFRVPLGARVARGDLWVPMHFTEQQLASRGNNYLRVLGRLAPGMSLGAAEAELRGLLARLAELYPGNLAGEGLRLVEMRAESVRTVRGPLALLLGAVLFVLLIAAANVASLLLARGVQRRRETAVRTALGAGRWGVVRPVLLESMMLAAAGVALGLGLAWAGVKAIGAMAAARIPQLAGLGLDLRVLGVALLTSFLVALLCGAVPAWRATAADPQDALRGGRGSGAPGQHRLLNSLVVAEVALSAVLLIGAGLVLRGFADVIGREPGFDPDPVLTLEVRVSPHQYPGDAAVNRFLVPALAAVSAMPGVEAAGAIHLLPYDGWGWNSNLLWEGQAPGITSERPLVERRYVTPGFFAVTGQRALAGRLLREDDDGRQEAPAVAVANEALVRRDFPGITPAEMVGKRFMQSNGFVTIVGVVSDIRNFGPFNEPRPEVYQNYQQVPQGWSSFPLMLRVAGDPAGAAAAVQRVIREVERGAAVSRVLPMREVMAGSVGRPRFYLALLGVFAGTALVLAMAGLFGVMSYAVARRSRDIGIRTALGATAARTVGHVLREGLAMVAGGLALGLLGGIWLSRLLTGLLYGVSPGDLATRAVVTVALLAIGTVAALVPAWRAARVDPLVAIRVE